MPTDSTNTAATLSPGDKLDKYEVVEQIGAGGFSVVWKAYDSLLGRHVAIKQIMPDVTGDDEAFREKVRNEAKVQKAVASSGKHLVHIYDVIDEPRGIFIVMEFVDGPSLEQFIAQQKGPIDQQTALGIIGATAIALQAIHSRDVIHRDLKPSNILLPNAGGLKVTDFGLAALIEEQEEMAAGSVRYMAPEMFHSDGVDHRADIYALSMIAYEMLGGRENFEKAFKVVLRDQRNQALRWMKWHTNKRVKATPLHELNDDVPEALSELVGRMMDKDVDNRIQTAQDALTAIRRHFASGSTADTSAAEQAARARAAETAAIAEDQKTAPLPKRNRLPWILAATLCFWLVVGGVVLGLRAQEQREKREAVATDARQAYNAAKITFESGDDGGNPLVYVEAKEKFKQVIDTYPQFNDLVRASEARIDWANAYIALNKARAALQRGEFKTATEQYDKARQLFIKADEYEILVDDKTQLTFDADQAKQGWSRAGMLSEIDELIVSGDLRGAQNKLNEAQQILDSPDERQVLEQFGERILGQFAMEKINAEVQRIKSLLDAGQTEEAEAALVKAESEYGDPRFRDMLAELRNARAYKMALETGRSNESGDDAALAKAISAYQRALSLQPDGKAPDGLALKEKINRLQSRQKYNLAAEHRKLGNKAQAQAAALEALDLWPDNSAAKNLLKELEYLEDQQALRRQAQAARKARRYEAAIRNWETLATKYGDSAEIQEEIRQDKISLGLVNAQQALANSEFDKAEQLFDDVRSMGPSGRQQQQIDRAMENISTWRQYLALRTQGDDYLQSARFGDAVRTYREAEPYAEKIGQSQELANRRTDAEYSSWIAQVKYFISTKNWDNAAAALRSATGTLSKANREMTPEVGRLQRVISSKGKEGAS